MNSFLNYFYKLISLNLNNFDISNVTDVIYFLSNYNSKMILCLDKIKFSNETAHLIEPFRNRSDCNNTCFTNPEHKLIVEKNICIDECYLDL